MHKDSVVLMLVPYHSHKVANSIFCLKNLLISAHFLIIDCFSKKKIIYLHVDCERNPPTF